MLEALRITNYAIIDQLDVEFSPALTVITGETGAGKSILLGAVRVLLGGRATTDMIRSGCNRAGIEGIFLKLSEAVSHWLNEQGFAADDHDDTDTLILRRDLLSGGSSRTFINGRAASVSQLKDLGSLLVDMHGQNDHSRLHSPAVQLQVLDSFGDYEKEINEYRFAYRDWRLVRERFDKLSTDQGDAQRRRDFLEFQVQEIAQAELKPGEDALLDAERRRLHNAERLRSICADVYDMLYEGERHENPVITQVGAASRLLQELAILDPDQEAMATEAESARFAVEDLAEKVRNFVDLVTGDPQRLDEVESRLELIRGLKRKYGSTLEAVLATFEKLSSELDDIINHDSALEEAVANLAIAKKSVTSTGDKLSVVRKRAAADFEKRVEAAMRELELPKAVLKIRLENAKAEIADGGDHAAFGPNGLDVCEFLVSLNAGEAPRPMRKVASGGEISRIMLAIKSVLARRDQVPTLVFDEIDTGISGEAAARVGDRLESLSASHQVICITHLPQVAARGARHLVVEKSTEKNRTQTTVRAAEGEARTLALAQMLSGANVDETSRRFAEKLLVRPGEKTSS